MGETIWIIVQTHDLEFHSRRHPPVEWVDRGDRVAQSIGVFFAIVLPFLAVFVYFCVCLCVCQHRYVHM